MKKIIALAVLASCTSLFACGDSYQGQYSQGYQGSSYAPQGYQGSYGSQGYEGSYGSQGQYSQGYQGSYGSQGYGNTSNENMDNSMNMNSDQKMAAQIKDDLKSMFSNKYNNVNVSVRNGQVTLQGSVATQDDKNSLEQKVRGMNGVQNVINQVNVQQSNNRTNY